MIGIIDEVLNDLGWNDGFRIPIANEENKKLEEEVEKKRKLKDKLSSEMEAKEELVQTIKKNIIHLTSQHDHNQNLISAYSAQTEAENNLYKTSQSTFSSMKQEINQFEKDKNETCERIANMEKDMSRVNEKLIIMESTIKVDQTRLTKWEKSLQRDIKDNEIIQHFIQSDTKKFKEYELKRQKLGEELENYRNGIVKAVDKLNEIENSLDQTARMYVQALKERRQLINQWTQSVLILRQRDNSIQETRKEMGNLREIAKEKMELFEDAEQFLKHQISNNKELDENIEQLEKEIFFEKGEQKKLSETIVTFESEIQIQKMNLHENASQTQTKRANIKRKKIEIENKQIKMRSINKQIDNLKITLNDISNQKMNVEDRIRQLEEMLEKEEKRKISITKETNRIQSLILRTTNQINELENERKIIYLRHQSEKKKIEAFDVFRMKIEKLSKKKKTELYNVEIEVQKNEIRLQHMTDIEKDRGEIQRKQKIIEDLQKISIEKMGTLKLLQSQVDHLDHDLKEMMQGQIKNNEELERLRDKKQKLIALIDGGEKQLISLQTANEEKQIEENLLRLKVNQIEKLMSSIDGKVYNLEKYRLQIEASMQERMAEIKAQRESLSIQKRVALNESSELRTIISERKNRIQQLRAKYDNNNALIGINPKDGQPLTSTYLQIQNAQEKYLLQEHGDELDRTIRKSECEIESMENTLRVVKTCNDKYKSSLDHVDENGPEKMEQKKLEEEIYNIIEKKKQIRNNLEEKQKDLKRMEDNFAILIEDIERKKEERVEKERYVENLERQITEQREKLLRAEKSLKKAYKDIQNMCMCTDDHTILWQEKDISARELHDLNNSVLQQVAEFTIRHVEAEAYVKKLLASKNIELPSKYYMRPSPSSSRCESRA
ncbi:coiled-coil domain-containing protein 39 [Leptopilina boulardi]|uniref:coiled-coil domain-containing protein 39 n=1 Tax=Leptopilina boulardi TaxID=63433 RepID=UPI0021F5ACA3|nr:coiled-coil domain-containing protein 39 [Leptopilina boulardi]